MTDVLVTRFVEGEPIEDWQDFDESGILKQIGEVRTAMH